MVDANVGYLTLNPSNKPIYKTTNGGATWTSVPIPLTGQIKKVRAIDPNLVYIGTSFGPGTVRVAKSTDGGASWAQIALPATIDLSSLDFQDANTGYACGNSTTGICRTTDGGASWSVQNSHTNTLGRIYAGPSGRGYALGVATSILRWAASLPPTPTPGPTATPAPTPTPPPTPTPTATPPSAVCNFPTLGFEDFSSVSSLIGAGWVMANNSTRARGDHLVPRQHIDFPISGRRT